MSALEKLVERCNEMDITEQLNWLGDAIMPYDAKKELAALREQLAKAEAFLNNLPESEIELAREVWGNTNTRIILEKRRELQAALKGDS